MKHDPDWHLIELAARATLAAATLTLAIWMFFSVVRP